MLPNELFNNEAAQRLASTCKDFRRPLALVLGHGAMLGAVHEADEGIGTHSFQLLMVTQVPVVALFAIKWLLRTPGQGVLLL
jgi:hypothetical protein